MFHMHVLKKFWSQWVLTATYLINRLPSRVLDFKSTYEVLKGKKLNLSHLKVFGCTCFVHIQSSHHDKLDPRAVKCVFLGYSSTQKWYQCYNPKTNKIVVSRDVKFEASPYFTPSVDSSGQGDNPLDLLPIPCLADVKCPSPIDGSGQEENHDRKCSFPIKECKLNHPTLLVQPMRLHKCLLL